MSDVFINSRGREVFADDVVPAVEDGYFAIFIKNKKVLLYWPPYGEAAEFIGGVCPRGEDKAASLSRMLYEQSGFESAIGKPEEIWSQEVDYFDARAANPFIHYRQVFGLFDAAKYPLVERDKNWTTPDGGAAMWQDLDALFRGDIELNYTHMAALKALVAED